MGFRPSFDRSWFAPSWPGSDEPFKESIAKVFHFPGEQKRAVLEATKADLAFNDHVDGSSECDGIGERVTTIRGLDLESLDQVVGELDHPQGFACHLRCFHPEVLQT